MRKIFLIGFMGCGKSFLGRQLAARLDVEFLDLDQFIEDTGGGHSIAEIFAQQGESSFRQLESAAIRQIVAIAKPLIVATDGVAPTGKLEAEKPDGICSHKINIFTIEDIDQEVIDWVKMAFEKAG